MRSSGRVTSLAPHDFDHVMLSMKVGTQSLKQVKDRVGRRDARELRQILFFHGRVRGRWVMECRRGQGSARRRQQIGCFVVLVILRDHQVDITMQLRDKVVLKQPNLRPTSPHVHES